MLNHILRRALNQSSVLPKTHIMVQPKVVFVLGAPGAGKGTQCMNIVNTYGYKHLSAGDLLREERQKPGSEYGELIENCIRDGNIVPVDITCSLLERAMLESGHDKFLIDGFPRNKDNLEGWERRVAEKVKLQFVLYFDCSPDVCSQRCLARGAAGSGRSDDNAESLKKRLNTHQNETAPIIEHYRALNIVRQIDGNMSKAKVFGAVKEIFDNIDAQGDQ